MAALAYLLLPLSGTIALLFAVSPRVRFHGAQAVVVGVVWAAALYAASAVSATLTRVVWGVGAIVWLLLLATTALGRDLRLPGVGDVLRSATDER